MRYKMIMYNCGEVIVDLKTTPKMIIIKPITPRKDIGFVYGCIEKLWDKGFRFRKINGANNLDNIIDHGDGRYTVYPGREGIPCYCEPLDKGGK